MYPEKSRLEIKVAFFLDINSHLVLKKGLPFAIHPSILTL